MQTPKAGFSLIELSVAIAVIALLLGGIVTTVRGINNAKIRATISEINEIQVAISQFEELYKYLPGDIATAETYWGDDCATPASACNGNGNWIVEFAAGITEDNRVFQHLSLAALYNKGTSPTDSLQPGDSIPASAMGGAYWFADHNDMHTQNKGNALALASRINDEELDGGFLLARDAYAIDEKIDDALAHTGYVQAANGAALASGCVDGEWEDTDVEYVLTSEEANCRLAFFYSLRP
jgi:prepilin-type N-terminal cleavage/methylation domain-containing protein